MKRIKPIIKSIVYGLLIFAGSTYAAKTYYANEVVYANQNGVDMTVGEALDDLYYASSNFANPTGAIVTMMSNEAPNGYLICDGRIYNINEYKKLAEHIKKQFGSYDYFGGNGTTTFAVPDLRGEFLRGTGTNSHANMGSGSEVGTHQDGTGHAYIGINSKSSYTVWTLTTGQSPGGNEGIQPIKTDSTISGVNGGTLGLGGTSGEMNKGKWTSNSQISNYTSRPTNTSVLYCIKY